MSQVGLTCMSKYGYEKEFNIGGYLIASRRRQLMLGGLGYAPRKI